MKVEATVDVGNNLTSLLERLAQQIGTTADKVFPWYVQQAYVEGVTTLAALAIVIPALAVIFTAAVRSKHWTGKYEEQPTFPFFASIVSGVLLCVSLVIGTIEGTLAARKMMNPNYYAMGSITRDIGRLVAK
jgi:hypothetical protein